MTIQNVVLIGASGNIGQFILAGLDQAGFDVTILSRQSSKATFPGRNVVTVADSYPHAELVAAFKGKDAVVCATTLVVNGKLDGSDQFRFIDAAIEAGVQRYLPSEFGADHRNAAAVEAVPLNAEKRKVWEYLQTKAGEIEWTSVATGPFFDYDFRIGFTGIDLKNNTAKIYDGGNGKFSVATRSQIGEGLAAALRHEQETANQFIIIESFPTSQNESVAVIEATGRKLAIEHHATAPLIAGSRAGFEAGNVYAMYGLLQAVTFMPGYGNDMSVDAERWRAILGLKKLSIEEEMDKVLADF